MSDEPIRIEYNQDLQALEAVLSQVRRSGDYFVSGTREIPMPQVVVEGIGTLSFPAPAAQVEELIQQATRAPYGRGEKTILDESVRKVWQIAPDKVQIGGKSWKTNFAGILEQAAIGLGCEGMPISAQLYKLLIYDPGAFFLAHRDTEKVEGMFGTLVLVLPSAHTGGELLIRHSGREVQVELSGAEFSEVAFAAFYADCEHEVRPIREGNRICLVYNLVHARGGEAPGQTLGAPDYESQIAAAASLLEETFFAADACPKLAWLLEHQYTPDGLSFSGLKSADAARAKVLSEAAERAGCVAHLCLVHIEESGAAEAIYRGYRGRGRRYDDEPDESSGNDFEVIEVSEQRHYLSQWRDRGDRAVGFGELPLAPGELLPAGALDGEEPDEQRFMEASGNEGGSFERSYLRAALVLWPRERYADVLLQAGPAAALPHLRELVDAAATPQALDGSRHAAREVARKIVEAWADSSPYSSDRLQSGKRAELLQLLTRLGEAELLEEFIREVVTPDYDGSENEALAAGARQIPIATMCSLYSALIHHHMRFSHAACIDLFQALATSVREWPTKHGGKLAVQKIAESVVTGLEDVGRPAAENEWVDWRQSQRTRAFDADLMRKLLETLGGLESPALCSQAAQTMAESADIFDPVSALAPAFPFLQASSETGTNRLWEHSAQFVLRRSGRPPEAPRDWRQEVNLACACADCRELRVFAENPDEQIHRFRVRQDRREHLERAIGRHGLDMTCQTERKGSPQTLVCAKNRKSYQRRCEEYRKDILALKTLAEQAARFSARTGTLNQIKAAIERRAQWTPA
jgi:2OG-Fe(II) oxygenase superfamily